jgi:dolichol-phosphate mannosyltransferase
MIIKTTVILCTYNEESIIKKTILEILKYNNDVEIIIVDDNSTDKTISIVEKMNNKEVTLIKRKSRGLGAACLVGLLYSKGENICWIDSNLPDLAKKIPLMLNQLNKKNIVVMSRYIEGGGDCRSFLRVLSSKFINYFCRIILNKKIKDYTSGIFAIKKSFLIDNTPISYGHGEYFIELLYNATKNDYDVLEIPYVQPPDIEGLSKSASSFMRFIKLGFQYIIRIINCKIRPN